MKEARFAAHVIRRYQSVIGQLTIIDKMCIFARSIITYYIAIVYGELYGVLHPSRDTGCAGGHKGQNISKMRYQEEI